MERLVNGVLTRDRTFVVLHQGTSRYLLEEFLKVWYVYLTVYISLMSHLRNIVFETAVQS